MVTLAAAVAVAASALSLASSASWLATVASAFARASVFSSSDFVLAYRSRTSEGTSSRSFHCFSPFSDYSVSSLRRFND